MLHHVKFVLGTIQSLASSLVLFSKVHIVQSSVLCLLFSFLMSFPNSLIYTSGSSYHLYVSESYIFLQSQLCVFKHLLDASTWMTRRNLRFNTTCSSCCFFISIIHQSYQTSWITISARPLLLPTLTSSALKPFKLLHTTLFRPGPSKQESRMHKNSHYSQTAWV